MREFFDKIYGDSQGYVVLVTKSDDGKLESQRWFEWPERAATVERYTMLQSDEDVYAGVSLFGSKDRHDPTFSHAVYADADTCHPDNFRLTPSIVVETSEGRWHCWWLVDEEITAQEASEASHRIYRAHRDQGVDSGWGTGKLLRVPGTLNTKYGKPVEVFAKYNDVVYTIDTINAAYADINLNTVDGSGLDYDVPPDIDEYERTALEDQLSAAGLSTLYTTVPPDGSDWSQRLYKLELELFRLGWTHEQVYNIAKEAACNKYARDRRSDADLWRDVLKAGGEYEATKDVLVDPSVRYSLDKANFLTTAEREYCQENPTFIDRYTQWVATRTDSAETYQRSLACVLLGAVFGGRGYLPLKWGRTGLNLWLLLLGDTTRTRKSTARSIFLRVLHRYEAVSQESIDIGTEATSEALVVELGKRGPMPASLMHKDEVNGWFLQLYTKQYRVGEMETLTELYDGNVPVVLRTSKDSGNRARGRTVFNFVGVGIRAQTANILTKQHFESGFLARMLWSVADPPPRQHGSEDVQFNDGEVQYGRDEGLEAMVTDLLNRVSVWDDDEAVSINMDKASRNRYNEWAEATMQQIERSGEVDTLSPPFKRLGDSLIKTAALLAMYDGQRVITLKHLLPALQQTELWYNDMVRMLQEVASSDFERRLNEVASYIGSGTNSMRLESDINRKFARLRPREMEEVISALKIQGRIRRPRGSEHQQKYQLLE